jgi:hypothetical protein
MPLVRAFRNWVRLTREFITVRRVTAAGIIFAAGTFAIAYLEYRHKGQEERLQRALSAH